MKTLKYGFFGEDSAQRIFLQNYLKNLPKQFDFKVNFEIDEQFCQQHKGSHRNKVKERFAAITQVSLEYWEHDVFFVGIDADLEDIEKVNQEFDEMKKGLPPQFVSKTCIFIPIQAIEHWIWYLKLKVENPNSNKTNPLEKQPRPEAKKAIYGYPRVSNEVSDPLVEKFTNQMDISHLLSVSSSFKHFHQQVISFLNNI